MSNWPQEQGQTLALEKCDTHHFDLAVFRIVQQLILAYKSRSMVEPIHNECKSLIVLISDRHDLNNERK